MRHALNFTKAAPYPIAARQRFRDGLFTYDTRTIDSTGAFLNGELERLDLTVHEPLVSFTWSRDVDLREDVSMGDESSSFTNSSFAAMGGVTPAGKAWIGKDANAIPGVTLDIGKTINALSLWGMEVKWTLPELASAQQVGRPIDEQKYSAMRLKWNMDADEQVYIGDTSLGQKGLFNHAAVTPENVAAGASTSRLWTQKTPSEILSDVNTALNAVWEDSAWAVMPNRLMIPPAHYGYLSSQMISSAGSQSILKYLNENNIVTQSGGTLEILPQKWLIGRGASATDRMTVYSKDRDRVRFPLVPLQRTPIEYRSLYQITTYYGRLGGVEVVYPETMGYFDGI